MNNQKILRALVMSMLFTTAYGGTMSLAANTVPSDGNLIASSITESQTFNMVTVTSNQEAKVQQGKNSYKVTNSNQNGWDLISGALVLMIRVFHILQEMSLTFRIRRMMS